MRRIPFDSARAKLLARIESRDLRLPTLSRLLGQAPTFLEGYIYNGEPREMPLPALKRLADILWVPMEELEPPAARPRGRPKHPSEEPASGTGAGP